MPELLSKDNPQSIARDEQIAHLRLQGLTYREIAEQAGVSFPHVGDILKREHCQAILEQGTREMLRLVPKAVDNMRDLLDSKDDGLRHKASMDVLKVAGVAPSHAQNTVIKQLIVQAKDATITVDEGGIRATLGHAIQSALPDADTVEGEIVPGGGDSED